MVIACSNFSNISENRNSIDTNKLKIINYQQFLLYSESNALQKINDLVGYEMQRFFAPGNSPKSFKKKS